MSADLLRAISAHGIGAGDPSAGAALDDDEFSDVFTDAARHRLVGLWLAANEAGAAGLTPRQRALLEQHQSLRMELCLHLDRLLLELHDVLDTAGLEHRFLKGVVHALRLYPDPALRPYGDVDLLVRGGDIDRALQVMGGLGIVRPKPELRPGFDRRFGKGVTMRAPARGRGTRRHGVDVHRTFASGPYAMTIDADALFDATASVSIGGTDVPVLGSTDMFLHACFNAAVSDEQPTLISQRDVVNAVLDDALDWEAAIDRAASWSAAIVVARAVRDAWQAIGPAAEPPIVSWATHYRPSRRERRFADSYLGSDQRWAREALAAVPVVPGGVRGKGAYLNAVLFPTKEAVERRKRTQRQRVASGVRLLARQVRPGRRNDEAADAPPPPA